MAIPELDDVGLLPQGVHACTLQELADRFRGTGFSGTRGRLVQRLERYLQELRETGLVAWVAIDGSFVTAKVDPGDIDLVVVLRSDCDISRIAITPALSRKWVAKHYEFDAMVAVEGTNTCAGHLQYFEQVKNRPGLTKGILQVVP
ncbi:MAG: hypothetical protein IPN34_23775 [Planctomycetes bacterium]|nr:hypothetical protein [Planctomycetota bacterium]